MNDTATGGGRTLSRDFKHVRRHAPGAPGLAFTGWMGFGVGLGLGLSVALAVHLYYRNQASARVEPVPAVAQAPASATATDDATEVAAGNGAPTAEQNFEFYDMLPKQEVAVATKPPKSDAAATAARLPTGAVVLQAGSFKQATEAEKMVGQLANAGVASKVQRASVEDETWYRVRIGPIATVEELESTRAKLDAAEITATPVTQSGTVPLP